MARFDAIVTENVEANRLLSMTGGNGAPHLSITEPGGTPDFVSTGALEENQTVNVNMRDKPVWSVEAGEAISAGAYVEVGEAGVIVASDDEGIGYITEGIEAGEIAKLVRQSSGGSGEPGPAGPEGPQGPEGTQGPAGSDGADGEDGFPTEQQWNELVSRVDALEGE